MPSYASTFLEHVSDMLTAHLLDMSVDAIKQMTMSGGGEHAVSACAAWMYPGLEEFARDVAAHDVDTRMGKDDTSIMLIEDTRCVQRGAGGVEDAMGAIKDGLKKVTDAVMSTYIGKKVIEGWLITGIRVARRQLEFMAMRFAASCSFTYNVDAMNIIVQVQDVDNLMQDMEFMAQQRIPPSRIFDLNAQTNNLLTNLVSEYVVSSPSGKQTMLQASRTCVYVAALRCTDHFILWLDKHLTRLLHLVSEPAPGVHPDLFNFHARETRRMCLQVMIPHLVSRAQFAFFQRMSQYIQEYAQLTFTDVEALVRRIIDIRVKNDDGYSVKLNLFKMPRSSKVEASDMARMLQLSLSKSFVNTDARYDNIVIVARNVAIAMRQVADVVSQQPI